MGGTAGDAVLFRSAHGTYLSFQGISIKTLHNVDPSCYFHLEQYEQNKVAIHTPQGYYLGISPHDEIYISDVVRESQLFTIGMSVLL
jgi:hypothetical protein